MAEGEGGEDEVWAQFEAVCEVLRDYGALDGWNATEFGALVGELAGNNELWLALVLVEVAATPQLDVAQLAAVLAATLGERARPDAYLDFSPSEGVLDAIASLSARADELHEAQARRGLGFSISLEVGTCGLVEAWARGVEWAELMAGTSLDAGDVYRLLRRTAELLRQVSLVPYASAAATSRARRALEAMDRYPIHDGALMAIGEPGNDADDDEEAEKGVVPTGGAVAGA